jgi:AraC-like DNA-binding protein/mannose-6-phosphate isomerase-like protein (cupin superfamily)
MIYKEPEPVLKDSYYRQPAKEYHIKRVMQGTEEYVVYFQNYPFRIWYDYHQLNFEKHWHNALEFVMPVDGEYDMVIEGKKRTIHTGEILFIPPKILHSIHSCGKGTILTYLFNPEALKGIRTLKDFLDTLKEPILFSKKAYPAIFDELKEILLKISNAYFEYGDLRELMIDSLLLKFFIVLGTYNADAVHKQVRNEEEKLKKYYTRLMYVVEYIDEHYKQNVSLDYAAQLSSFSKYHFIRVFKEFTGMTLTDYIAHKRIDEAVHQLHNSDKSVTEIALDIGFENLSSFNKSFRKIMNCSPTQYKSAIQQ